MCLQEGSEKEKGRDDDSKLEGNKSFTLESDPISGVPILISGGKLIGLFLQTSVNTGII